jgi:hypothetical protein
MNVAFVRFGRKRDSRGRLSRTNHTSKPGTGDPERACGDVVLGYDLRLLGTIVLEPEGNAETLTVPGGRLIGLDLVLDQVETALPLMVGGFKRRLFAFEGVGRLSFAPSCEGTVEQSPGFAGVGG